MATSNQSLLGKISSIVIDRCFNFGPETSFKSDFKLLRSSANTKKIDELIQADIDALTDSSGFSGDEARTSTDYPSKTSTLNKSSSPEIKEEASGSASQKRSAKKRKITDINSLLMMKEQEQESER